jgi:hypothetical protein
MNLLYLASATSEMDGGLPSSAMFLIIIVAWIFGGVVLMKIANKTGTENGWMAFIPILNAVLLCQCAGKPGWWFILMCIPFVNIIITIIVWMGVAERCGRPSWWGVVISLIPIVNLILVLILAFEPYPQQTRMT